MENEADNACMILVQLELSKATVEIPKIISNLAAVYLINECCYSTYLTSIHPCFHSTPYYSLLLLGIEMLIT